MNAELEANENEAPIRSGRVLGRYVLCYELASGGMATVYLARTDGAGGFGKLVALKLIHPHLAKQREFVDMFMDEARIAARIVHPNVCSVFDFGEEEGTYFLAMDYLVGETAGKLMRTAWKRPNVAARKKTLATFAKVIADAAEGLHAAHEVRGDDGRLLGVVHRDVTPQNLFVGYDGSVRVVDFGVALAVDRAHHTAVGTLKGKYPYMAPEQVRQKDVDRRADVWGLGVCLWEMLAGRRLFQQKSEFDTLRAVTELPVPKVSDVNPDVPPVLDAIVAQALSRDREVRFATARDLSRELDAAIATLGGASAGDVAELMDELFATERRERALLMEKARKLDPEHPSTSKVKPMPPGLATGEATPTPSPLIAPLPGPAAPEPPARPAWLLPAAGIGALLFVAIALALALGGSDEPAGVAAAAAHLADAGPLPADVPIDVGIDAPTDAGVDAPIDAPARREERRRREETSAAPAGGSGRLSVVTPPGWAEIYVGGRRVGRSPTELTLPAGRHAVRLVPYGEGTPIERSVTVQADATERLVVRLPPP